MIRLGEELRVELSAQVKRMIGEFDDFHETLLGGDG